MPNETKPDWCGIVDTVATYMDMEGAATTAKVLFDLGSMLEKIKLPRRLCDMDVPGKTFIGWVPAYDCGVLEPRKIDFECDDEAVQEETQCLAETHYLTKR